jgi:hypothetical protein
MKLLLVACIRFISIAYFICLSATAQAEYPDKPIRLIIPFVPGGTTDQIARSVGTHLSRVWGQPVVMENKPGANGVIASEALVTSKSDGYTLMLVAMGHAINPLIYKKLPYDTDRDFTPVTLLAKFNQLILVNPNLPASNVKELIALSKIRPLTYGSGGNGSSQHLAGALFFSMAGIQGTHIPYKGGSQAMLDTISGNIDMMVAQPSSPTYVSSGQLKALAIATKSRSPDYPNTPTVKESGGPSFESYSWYGLVAPKNLPPEILNKLNAETLVVLNSENFKHLVSSLGGETAGDTPAEFSKFIKDERKRYSVAFKNSEIKLD